MIQTFLKYIASSIPLGVPLLYGSTGEIITEKGGHLNLGLPGIMYVGAISSMTGAFIYEGMCNNAGVAVNPALAVLIPVLCCIIGSVLMGLIYSFLTVTLKVNQNVTGLAMTTFGVGLGNFLGGSLIKLVDNGLAYVKVPQTSSCFHLSIPGADSLGWFGQLFLSHDFLTYTAIIIALIASFILTRTRVGLNLRSVGENPATADAAGISVTRYRYVATFLGSGIAALGGLCYIMDNLNGNWEYTIDAIGWLAIALVIFTIWRPNVGIIGSIIFGALYIASSYISGVAFNHKAILKMLPYVVTIIVLVITSMRKKRETQPPQSLGLPYFREER